MLRMVYGVCVRMCVYLQKACVRNIFICLKDVSYGYQKLYIFDQIFTKI